MGNEPPKPYNENSPLLMVVREFLGLKGREEDAADWFLSGIDTKVRIREISKYVFENVHTSSGRRVFGSEKSARRIVILCYREEKEGYDRHHRR